MPLFLDMEPGLEKNWMNKKMAENILLFQIGGEVRFALQISQLFIGLLPQSNVDKQAKAEKKQGSMRLRVILVAVMAIILRLRLQ